MKKIYKGSLLFLLSALFFIAGCTYTVHKEFPISQGKINQYLECLKTPAGICHSQARDAAGSNFYEQHVVSRKSRLSAALMDIPAPVRTNLASSGDMSALEVWEDPVQRGLIKFYYKISVPPGDTLTTPTAQSQSVQEQKDDLHFTATELQEYYDKVLASMGSEGWSSFKLAMATYEAQLNQRQQMLQAQVHQSQEQQKMPEELQLQILQAQTVGDALQFIRAYLLAYFRNGEFFKASLDTTTAKANVARELKDRLPGLDTETARELAAKLLEKFVGNQFFGKIGTVGFVTRAGSMYQFPSVEARFDPLAKRPITVSKIDFPTVGADIIRIVLEGTFDAIERLPAVSNATGVNGVDGGLQVHDPKNSKVSAEEFGQVDQIASRGEAAASTAFGQLIRGAGWISLNNEALAKLLETAVGVTIRKLLEICAWCYYACELNRSEQQKAIPGKAILSISVSADRKLW